jgi:hypothetical protein
LGAGSRGHADATRDVACDPAEVREEAETGLSKCKLTPRSFPDNEPPALKFSALLMENGTERLEVGRA